MLLCGLWHGAAWTYVLWGAVHGLYLMLHRIFFRNRGKEDNFRQPLMQWLLNLIKTLITFHLVAFAWILFRAVTLNDAFYYFVNLFRYEGLMRIDHTVIFACLVVICLDMVETWFETHAWLADRRMRRPVRYALAQILFISAVTAAIAHVNTLTPFIYFQF
jgi:D-alanyl-lipoteichoic acid acyltransferase DltB (MBOAT superfamily)